ncbi:uncharacterized protein [Nicotiana sylvestris]|uniref:uncharacterized protein n=1 Tax=Nicotiana sylvestris TaxID=4096 RepID=UPI00388C8B71
MVVPKAKAPLRRPPLPYPQRLAKQNNENQFKKFINMMKSLSINVPLVETLEQMPGYAKYMKDLVDYEVLIILGRPFLATWNTLVDVEEVELTFRVGNEKVVFHVFKSMRNPNRNEVCSFVDLVTEVLVEDTSVVINVEDPLEAVLLNHDVDEKEGLVEYVNALQGIGSYTYEPRKLSLDLEKWKAPPTKPSIEEPPILELKPFPSHFRCVPEEEQLRIFEACHSSPYGGHHGGARTATKVLSYGFYWPTLYKDASKLIKWCYDCQRAGRISKKNEMSLTTILEIDIFDV